MGYLGYDRQRLVVLLGALEELGGERLLGDGRPSRWAQDAADRHRRATASLTAFADRIGAALHGDPLGRYRDVCLDPSDLDHWALHRGGAWATVTDPTLSLGGPGPDFTAVNARVLAHELTPARLRELLRSRGAAQPLVHYLAGLATDPAARLSFLEALGPGGFAALLDVCGRAVVEAHQAIGPQLPRSKAGDELLTGLGRIWATTRAEGALRTRAWDQAVLAGPLYVAGRALEIAATSPGALTSHELAAWGGATWQRLIASFGTDDAPWPTLVGDQVLGALYHDGRAARSVLLDLGADTAVLGALLSDVAASPAMTGALLLASTDPSTVSTAADDDEVRRSMQDVLRTIGRLLDGRRAGFARMRPDGAVDVSGTGWILPTDLGTYAGRYAERMIDPRDGSPGGPSSTRSYAWRGWDEGEVERLLSQLVQDPLTAGQLQDAAIAGLLRRIGQLDLTTDGSDAVVENGVYVVAAVEALVRNRELDHVIHDGHRFEQLVAGADLAVTVAGIAGPNPVLVPAETWAWMSRLGGVTGHPSPGAVLLSPFRPTSVREALARGRASQALDVAVLKQAVAAVALEQLRATGQIAGPTPVVPTDPDEQVTQLVERTRPGDNANAAGDAYLDRVETWVDEHRGEPAGRVVEGLMDSVGDAAARGAGWVA